MTPTTKHAAGPQAGAHASSAAVGAFMLTLCRLETPVTIRPSQSPQLARFKFFMSRTRYVDGTERLHLHMGYFSTRAEAEKCAQIMRTRYPQATVTALVPSMSARAGATTKAGPSVGPQARPEPPVLHGIPASEAGALTDTQVLQILDKRRVQSNTVPARPRDEPEISLLRPDDTNTRRALKEAVAQGTPVSFVVQLCQSDQPIQLNRVPALDIFRAYKVYLAQGDHHGRRWQALRLGFFSDAESAKQVAYYTRRSYAAVAVIPIDERERVQANAKPIALTLLGRPSETSIDDVLVADQARSGSESDSPNATKRGGFTTPAVQNRPTAVPTQRRKDSLEQTLELLAASAIWDGSESDTFSETGVRHLQDEVHKRSSRRS